CSGVIKQQRVPVGGTLEGEHDIERGPVRFQRTAQTCTVTESRWHNGRRVDATGVSRVLHQRYSSGGKDAKKRHSSRAPFQIKHSSLPREGTPHGLTQELCHQKSWHRSITCSRLREVGSRMCKISRLVPQVRMVGAGRLPLGKKGWRRRRVSYRLPA